VRNENRGEIEINDFVQATIDVLSAHIAVLDEQGIIVTVNRAWRAFAQEQQFAGSDYGIGQNYIELCETTTGRGALEAHQVARGIRDVMQGLRTEYSLPYPCHTPHLNQWFQAHVTRFTHNGQLHMIVAHENVSEAHLAREILEERESFLRMLISSVDAIIWALDSTGKFVFVEGHTQPVVNMSAQQMIGHSVFELLHDRPAITNQVRRALAGENLSEKLIVEAFCYEVRYTPMRNAQGEITGTVGIAIDITERERAEEALRKSHQEMLTIWESISDAFFAVDHEWHFTYVNAQAEIMLHHRREALLGRKVWEVFPDAIGSTFYHEYHRALRDRVSVNFEAAYAPFDLWAEVTAYYSEVGLSVYMRDITQRKLAEQALRRSEEQFKTLADTVPQHVWTATPQGTIDYVNRNGLRDYQRTLEQLAAEGWLELLHPDDVSRAREIWGNSLATGEPYNTEFRIFHAADQTYHWYIVRALPLLDDNNNISKWFGSSTDITERKRMEEALRQSNEVLEARVEERTHELRLAKEDAERANQAKTEFLSRMSHELRTPLNAILGFGQLLEMPGNNLTPRQQKGVTQITSAGHHLLELINEILDISRLEAGRIAVSLEPVALSQVLLECLDLVSPLSQDQNIKLQYVPFVPTADDANQFVQADRQRLKQVLLNLLSNAIKYNRQGGTVTVTSQMLNDGAVRISITDTGWGLTAEQIQKLFVPFERLNAFQSNIEGTGLGLAVSKHLVKIMGGQIGVESQLGKGSTFFVDIPHTTGGLL
jgi:PAS domain S-box-containing protein